MSMGLLTTTVTTSSLMTVATDILTEVLTEVTEVVSAITSSPYILMWAMFPVATIGISIVKRLCSTR